MERIRLSDRLLTLARLTNAQWLAVSMFEDVIDLPARIAEKPSGGAFGHGSPARYHVLAAVPTIASALGAVLVASTGQQRRTLGVALTGTLTSAALTGFLIRSVNIPLLSGSVGSAHRERLVRRWHRINKVRLALLLVVVLMLERAAWSREVSAESSR